MRKLGIPLVIALLLVSFLAGRYQAGGTSLTAALLPLEVPPTPCPSATPDLDPTPVPMPSPTELAESTYQVRPNPELDQSLEELDSHSSAAESTYSRESPVDNTTQEPPASTTAYESSVGTTTHEPNEMGDIMVLVYHAIGWPEQRWRRTPTNFRRDLERMYQYGYYPVNLIDVVRGNLDHVPQGRRPIVLTFDDSTVGQFRYLEDGTVDPDCAVGAMLAMHEQYGDDWPLRATFFVLMESDEPGYPLFRQPESAVQKLRELVEWGMEIGSHTVTHPYLSMITPDRVEWELAVSQNRIEALLPGYEVRSLSVPFGSYPSDVSILGWGHAESLDLYYEYEAAVRVEGGPAPSPFSPNFRPLLIPRVQAIQAQLDSWFFYYEQHPERYYVSDGMPGTN